MRALPLLLLLLASPAAAQATREIAGKPLGRYPHFQFVTSFNEGEPIDLAFDPRADPYLAKRALEIYVVAHEELPEFRAGRKLESRTGKALAVRLNLGGVLENTFRLDGGPLRGGAATTVLGRGYDVIADVNHNARLDAPDVIDGSDARAGFYVVQDFVSFKREGTKETGPFSVVETLFFAGGQFQRQDIYYPANIAELGELPLVVISHGNGHNYQWYDHIGYHLASWGYVVMSHSNNTGPGIDTASTSTLRNTNILLNRTVEVDGGALVGHIDRHHIVWIGHSRGGEGVVWAYRRMLNGDPIPTAYGVGDIRLVSSMAPTDFRGSGFGGVFGSDVGAVPYHLWTGGSDNDVNGCANCDICQTFHLLERADGLRLSTSLHGAGHGDFHDGGGSSVAAGPCLLRRDLTHPIMRGYLLPLVQFVLDGNPACRDFLTRQYEEFRPLGAPALDTPCVSVDLMFLDEPGERRVIDDFQSEPAVGRSSSGGEVLASAGLAPTLVEGRLDDINASFTESGDPMNGMTLAGPGDPSAGLVLEWSGADEFLSFELPAGQRDLSGFARLSFRAAQVTRDALTRAELGDLDFEVELADSDLHRSTIRISAYGGGIEEPYLRGGCGEGNGWGNEFESVRIALDDFRRDGSALDLTDVVAVSFLFGPSHGSADGRIGLDELVLTRD